MAHTLLPVPEVPVTSKFRRSPAVHLLGSLFMETITVNYWELHAGMQVPCVDTCMLSLLGWTGHLQQVKLQTLQQGGTAMLLDVHGMLARHNSLATGRRQSVPVEICRDCILSCASSGSLFAWAWTSSCSCTYGGLTIILSRSWG